MTHKFHPVADILHLASTSRSKSVVSAAAIAFAVCHLVVLAAAPTSSAIAGNPDAGLARQLVYIAAVLGRFAVPLCIMIVGMTFGRSKSRGS